jgi:hypothetical protein
MAHHEDASASIAAAMATLPYPIALEEAVRRVGDWKVPLAPGETVPLGQLLAGIPQEQFKAPEDALRAVDQHWGRMMGALEGE